MIYFRFSFVPNINAESIYIIIFWSHLFFHDRIVQDDVRDKDGAEYTITIMMKSFVTMMITQMNKLFFVPLSGQRALPCAEHFDGIARRQHRCLVVV